LDPRLGHPTRALVHLDRLTHNLRLLQDLVGERPLWPAVKANAYGHGLLPVARHLVGLGYRELCVAHAEEALELRDAGVRATLLVLSPALPEQAGCLVEHGLEPVVCGVEMLEALSRAAVAAGTRVPVHLKVDTGMGRVGVPPEEVLTVLDRCRELPGVRARGLMSHLPRADEADKSFSLAQIEVFRRVREATRERGVEVYHLANSAGILDLPGSHFDAARPGIATYGLAPSATIASPRVRELRPVLEWRTRVTFLKEVRAGTGLSYGHTFRTSRASLVATLPVGYGDGLRRSLSNRGEVLVHGTRCPQVGTITMDQSLVDVTALRGRVAVGDEAVLIGRQGAEELSADELAAKLGTISYEIVTAIAERVPRVVLEGATDA
jgi:alanine racemase